MLSAPQAMQEWLKRKHTGAAFDVPLIMKTVIIENYNGKHWFVSFIVALYESTRRVPM